MLEKCVIYKIVCVDCWIIKKNGTDMSPVSSRVTFSAASDTADISSSSGSD